MKQMKWLLVPALLIGLLALVGCEREVTGKLQPPGVDEDECFVCHNGFLDQAQGEWLASTHASGSNIDYTNRGGSDCTQCHNQEGFLQFLNTGTVPQTDQPQVSAIGCFTCHNPHETGDLSVRAPGPYTFLNGEVFDNGSGNLCVHCHHQRGVTGSDITDGYEIASSRFGPHHGPQGEMLIGTGGYEGFPGFSVSSSPHETIQDGCVHCHMANERAHEGYKLGGHSFNMVDAESGLELVEVCEACHSNADAINFVIQDAGVDQDFDYDGVPEGFQDEIHGLLDSLEVLLKAQGIMQASGFAVTGTYPDGDLVGALFNYKYVEEDQSLGSHDFAYSVALLQASIAYVDGLLAGTPQQAGDPISQK